MLHIYLRNTDHEKIGGLWTYTLKIRCIWPKIKANYGTGCYLPSHVARYLLWSTFLITGSLGSFSMREISFPVIYNMSLFGNIEISEQHAQ